MCGIAGVLSLNNKGIDTTVLKDMVDSIAHRGPDDSGYLLHSVSTDSKGFKEFCDSRFRDISPQMELMGSASYRDFTNQNNVNLFFGHRRLSIIDLSPRGHQPMSNEDRTIWVIHNGEIYNFLELRKKLENSGCRFKSRTDTEVIIYAYEKWGIDCIRMFNGMFAFALWDDREKVLYLARDRYGIKPLYYTNIGDVFLFASEIKAFLRYPNFKAKLDFGTLLEYFTFQNTFSYKTLFEGVKILPPGHYMQISLNRNREIDIKQYWDFNFVEERGIKTESEYQEELDRLFRQAVKRQLVSDVEIGSHLSGGIDTGSIVAVTSQFFKELKTFCIGFDLSSVSGLEVSLDEREKAEHISYLYQTEHYEMVLKSGDMKRCLPNLVWSLEDLRLGQSYPNFYASKLASKFVKVCLSGAGGDELFAGYPWRYYRTLKSKNFNEYIDGYYKYWQRLVPNKILKKLFSPISSKVKEVWTEDIFRNVFGGKTALNSPEECINNSLYFEIKTFLHGLLIVDDKLSMAHGLEMRIPFLDNDLVDFALKVPVRLKLRNIDEVMKIDEDEVAKTRKYFGKTHDGKVILRKVLEQYVGSKITSQYKQGFTGPDASWFKGESIDYVKDLLMDKEAKIYEYFKRKTVDKLIKEHMDGKQNRRLFIWSLLCFETWLKQFL